MKFFNLITLASLVTAVPQFRRQNSVTRDIKASADELSATVMTTLTTIDNAVAAIKNTAAGSAVPNDSLVSLKADINAIDDALVRAKEQILGVTAPTGTSTSLSGAQLIELAAALRRTTNTCAEIRDTVSGLLRDLPPAILSTVQAEVNAVKAGINPLLRSLLLFTAAARSASTGIIGGGILRGLDSALTKLIQLQRVLVSDIGILSIGDLPSLGGSPGSGASPAAAGGSPEANPATGESPEASPEASPAAGETPEASPAAGST